MPEICPHCKRALSHPNAWHYCAEIAVDSLFENRPAQLLSLFDRLLGTIGEWEGVSVSATRNCIVFVRNKTFLVIRPMKKALDLKFYLPEASDEFPIYKSAVWNSKYETCIRIMEAEDLSAGVYRFIRKSYEIS